MCENEEWTYAGRAEVYFLHPFLGNNINTHLQNVIPEKSEVENEPDHHIFLHSGLQLR